MPIDLDGDALNRCPGCPVAAPGLCWPIRANVRRLCQLPEFAGSIAAWGADGGPTPAVPSQSRPVVLVGWPACSHRATRWNCNDEMTATCALGHGQAGIVDREDCAGCADATG